MSVEVAKDAAIAAPAEVKDDAIKQEVKDDAVKKAQEEYRSLHFTRRRYRSQIARFQKGHKFQIRKLDELSKEDTDEGKKACAKHAY